jgi:hypothetical protein
MFDIPIADIGEPIADLSSLSSSCSVGSSAPSSGEILATSDVEATFRLGRLEQALMFARKKSPDFRDFAPGAHGAHGAHGADDTNGAKGGSGASGAYSAANRSACARTSR